MKSVVAPLTQLHHVLNEDMLGLNNVLISRLTSDVPLVSVIAKHLLNAGGKRIRPLLTIASQRLLGTLKEEVLYLGAAVELIHNATLLHDDVVDGSMLRRGQETANALWGNTSSVLVGDFLFSRAFQLMVMCKTEGVLNVLANALANIAEGEVMQMTQSHSLDLDRETYLLIAQRKTAGLFEAACTIGSMVGDGTPEQIQALATYGRTLGLAFQITDDIFDYFPPDHYGKTPGDDFFEGKVTLPIMILADILNGRIVSSGETQSHQADATWLNSLFIEQATRTPDDYARVCDLCVQHNVFDHCMHVATNFAQQAVEALSLFPETHIRLLLQEIPPYMVDCCRDVCPS